MNLAGLHDRESTALGIIGTWALDTIALPENPTPPIYDSAYSWITRLNWGYGSSGTLPIPARYSDYVQRTVSYVAASKNCRIWIVGNEPSLPREWPDGQPIFPWQYADAYRITRNAIHALPGHERDEVLIAVSGPWNNELKYPGNPNGDWIKNFADVIGILGDEWDGASLHSYCHGYSVALVTSSARMQAPFQSRHYEFRAYQDYMEAIPAQYRHKSIYLTEANGNGPWQAVGLMPAILNEIDNWNKSGGQPIKCVIFYRFSKYDDFCVDGKADVLNEYRQAVAKGYQSPAIGESTVTEIVHLPTVSTGAQAAQPWPRRDWDERLTQRGVTVETPPLAPGQQFWRVTRARWYNEQEADLLGPDRHIMVDVRDGSGKRVIKQSLLLEWPGDHTLIYTEPKQGEQYAVGYGMSPSLNEFSISVDDGLAPSEKVRGIGMGDKGNPGIHTSTGVFFQLATAPQAATPPLPATLWVRVVAANLRGGPGTEFGIVDEMPMGMALTVTGATAARDWVQVRVGDLSGWVLAALLSATPVAVMPAPAPSVPMPTGDNWARCIAFVLKAEGGFANDKNDAGGATMKGITIGTYTAWRKAQGQPQPTVEELRNITDAEVEAIYRAWYWQASGADKLPWPLCLGHFDLAVNGGVARAKEALAAVGPDFVRYCAWRLNWYTRLPQFNLYGVAWTRRVANLMMEAAK